jgi:hypothetical protein
MVQEKLRYFDYAEGVILQSPGSSRSGAPWVCQPLKHLILKGLYPPNRSVSLVYNPFRINEPEGSPTEGALARPWALEFNTFGVKSGPKRPSLY